MSNEKTKLVAPCGIFCGDCELYQCRDNAKLKEYLISRGIPSQRLPCDGCRNIDGRCPVIGQQCATFRCATDNLVDFCFECRQFPCRFLAPAADRAGVLPHNTKLFNLGVIERDGLEEFLRVASEIRRNYFKGKMEIGRGPQPEEQE